MRATLYGEDKNEFRVRNMSDFRDTRDTEWVLKWVLVRIAAFCCAQQPQIWIPEIEYYQKMASHAQIGPQGAEK